MDQLGDVLGACMAGAGGKTQAVAGNARQDGLHIFRQHHASPFKERPGASGSEQGQRFYGHSFIADEWGDFVCDYGAEETGVLIATIDLARAATHRAGMGFFRDRRPQLYGRIAQDI